MPVRSMSFFSRGTRCAAELRLPESAGTVEPVPGIVMCHGFRGVKEWFLPDTADAFAAAGFAVLTFDYRGFGASDGRRGSLVPADQIEDIRSALSFLGTQPEVDAERLGLWGTSFGCSNVIAAAAADPRARAVVGQVGIGSVPRAWLNRMPEPKRGQLLTRIARDAATRVRTGHSERIDPAEILDNEQSHAAFAEAAKRYPQVDTTMPLDAVERILEFEPERVVAAIAPRPLLLIGASLDLAVPPEETQRLYDAAGEPKAIHMLDITHYEIYEPPAREHADRLAVEWFRRWL